jgi:hypothetical protein
MRRKLPYYLIAILSGCMYLLQPARAEDEVDPAIATIVVNEPQDITFKAIERLRTTVKHRKLESYNPPVAIIREQFPSLPLIGERTCLYKEVEDAPNRIEYSLIKGDNVKEFKGVWSLKPLSKNSTEVTLTTYADAGVRIPFWKEISKEATTRVVHQRLRELQLEAHKLAQEQSEKIVPSDSIGSSDGK